MISRDEAERPERDEERGGMAEGTPAREDERSLREEETPIRKGATHHGDLDAEAEPDRRGAAPRTEVLDRESPFGEETEPVVVPKRARTWPFHLGALALLGVLLILTGEAGRNASATADEPIYIRSGLLILEGMDPSVNDISSPFLIKALNALPLSGMEGALETARRTERLGSDPDWPPLLAQWRAGVETVQILGSRKTLAAARLVPRATAVLLGLLLYLAGLAFLRPSAALAGLFVYVMLPETQAHASLATLDMGLAFFTFLTLILLAGLLRRGGRARAAMTGVALGLTLLAKTTGVVLALFVGLVWIGRFYASRGSRASKGEGAADDDRESCDNVDAGDRIKTNPRRDRLGELAILVIAAWLTLNGAFLFEGTFDPLSVQPEYPKIAEKLDPIPGARWSAEHLPVLLPSSFVHTLVTQMGILGKGKRIFFDGETSVRGWWWLMIVTFAAKMPLAFLLLAVAGLFAWKGRPGFWVFPGFAVFLLVFFTVLSRANCGVRYLLPVLPGLALASGVILAGLIRKGKPGVVAAGLLMAWLVVAAVWVFPRPLSYANEAAGGPGELYRLLGDSNVDWGQDLPALAEVMNEEGIDRVRLSFFGSDDPAVYGIEYDPLPSIGLPPEPGKPWWFEPGYEETFSLEPGFYAVSANNLNGLFFKNPDLFAAFRTRTPDFRAGGSILLYRVQ